jgi:hypothetical protein
MEKTSFLVEGKPMNQKVYKKPIQNTNPITELIPYFKSILEECKDEGIIVQGNAFIGKTKKEKRGEFLRMRFEILRGKPHREKKSI